MFLVLYKYLYYIELFMVFFRNKVYEFFGEDIIFYIVLELFVIININCVGYVESL